MSFPDKQSVLDFLRENPSITSKQDIARGLQVKGRERQTLRQILKDLEADGSLKRTGKRAFARSDVPPPTSVIAFEGRDEDGELLARAVGKKGPFGPVLIYDGYSKGRKGTAPGIGDRGLARLNETDGVWTAHLMKLFERRDDDQPVVGLFERTRRGGEVKPASRKEKRSFLISEADTLGAEDGDLVKILPLPQKGHGPSRAKVIEAIGRKDDPRAPSLLALAAYDIPTEFPDEVIKQAQNAKPAKAKREDLRKTPLITIDPADARDHDDAVYAERLDDGWRVIVAIADVAAFVTPGSALDREAAKRGNSTYFPDRVVPMLPFELSAGECSLKEGEDRLCFAVEIEFDTSGTKRTQRFYRAIMRSAAGLSYEVAQTAIDGAPNEQAAPLLETVLKPLWGAYEALKTARARRAPLDLDLPERKVYFDDDGKIAGIRTKQRFDAHKLIEEFMIQANVAAAEALEAAKSPPLYRIHDSPTEAKIAALADFLKTLDVNWPLGEVPQTRRFNKLLADFEDSEEADAISEIVLRSQAQAIYSPENIGHFGLNLTKYAHFTSPIRRYSDLVVHRSLIRGLSLGPDGLTDKDAVSLEDMASHLVTTERRSMAAERDASDRYLALFLADRVGAELEGRITGVTRAGLFVRLAETGADGFVPAAHLSHEFWHYDDGALALIAEQSGKRYELGQEVTARLREVTPLEGGLLLEIVSNPRPARPGQKLPVRRKSNMAKKGGRGKPPPSRKRKRRG